MGYPEIMLPRISNETYLPTLQNSPRTHARFSGSHENPWRPCRHQRTPRQRPQASGSLSLSLSVVAFADPLRWFGLVVQRLKTRPQFQAVLAGSTVARTAHFALHRAALDTSGQVAEKQGFQSVTDIVLFADRDVWVGAMVPKRWAKRAVTRNAIKRQIYTVSTLFESALPVAAHVVRLRAGFDKSVFVSATSDAFRSAVRQELVQLFSHAGAKVTSVASLSYQHHD